MLKIVSLLISLLLPSTAMASTEVLLFDDIGPAEATFAWDNLPDRKVAIAISVERGACMDGECYDDYSTGALAGFERSERNVYYVGDGSGKIRVLCGRTGGIFSLARFGDACRIRLEPEHECVAWFLADDCGRVVTRHRVYLTIDE